MQIDKEEKAFCHFFRYWPIANLVNKKGCFVRSRALLHFVFVALCASQFVCAQATVNESLETAYLYVDVNKGSDSNPGTQAEPLKTIGAASALAEANNKKSIGTRITINPGTYRESIVLHANSYDTALPITFQGATAGVIISGAVQYSDWQTYSGNSAIYSASWTNNWGTCALAGGLSPFEQEIVLRQEMIFVNGVPLTQVLSFGQMLAGTFWVDEPASRVYIWPAAGTDINTADVEVATLPQLFNLVGKQNVVLRGLTFEYANTCRDNPAVYIAGASQNILVDNDLFQWNNAVGLHLFAPTTYFTVQNSTANHNGQSGMMATQTKFGLWKNDTTSFNNWRGAQGSYYYWASGGTHFFSQHDQTVTGLQTAYNQTHGVHLDTDNANITFSDLVSVQNLAMGTVVEKSEGPVSIAGSYFCGNNNGNTINHPYQGGLVLRNSELVTMTGSTLYNNQIAQISVIGQKGGISVANWETGQVYNLVASHFTHTGNVIEAVGANQQTFSDSYLGGTDWTTFQTTLTSNKNVWWNGSQETAFEVPINSMHPLSGWQSVTGQDSLSNWTQPSGTPAACNVAPVQDYWLLVSSPSQTLSAVGNTTFDLNLIPFGGLSGTASLSFDGTKEVKGLSGSLSAASSPLANGAFTLTVNAAVGTVPGTYPVTVLANLGGKTRTVTASLVVPATSVRLSTIGLTFPTTKVRTNSAAQTITLRNVGSKAFAVSSIVATGNYTETNNCGTSLAAGATCTVEVTFNPKATGSRPGTIKITDADATSPQIVTLAGVGD